jgi:hypothetical protein
MRRRPALSLPVESLARFSTVQKQKPLRHFCVFAFSDGKPDSTPAFASASAFLKMLYEAASAIRMTGRGRPTGSPKDSFGRTISVTPMRSYSAQMFPSQ